MPKPVIQLNNISKNYYFNANRRGYLKRLLPISNSLQTVSALKNINLTINQGDKIGIIGSNGAGKTTLLKIIAGITKPTSGSIKVNGKVAALLQLESGFHPELTGKENILLNGLLIGITKSEVNKKLEQIIKFADIGKFIHAPFYTYSSGMKFRLAFSIAIISQSQILIMDEIFSAGDMNFQLKSINLLKKIQKNKQLTTIMCSHEPFLIWEFSKKFYQLDQGNLSIKSKKQVISIRKKRVVQFKKIFPHAIWD